MHLTKFSIIFLLVLTNFSIADQIYQYTDKNGTTVFTNKPSKNAKKIVNLPVLSVYASPMSKNDYSANGYTKKPNNKLKTSSPLSNYLGDNEQKRNQILSEELAHETQALKDAQTTLTQGQATKLSSEQDNSQQYQNRIQGLQDAVTEHEKNIDILSKQLGVSN